ncbi:hypothetical protein CspeluHIS016_0305320 [Cutaneotrichosporon spelunceum]|uniref:Uncharacterized protein n=1 Tax=Cutaneotrichosporon spelunceum TaxID=1672016 RepID=A0AAD3YC85_9TREE|nr:hypothetical protein CspeluHIS016_0305320 [Cutaneotrichosporon spelunceum]
MIPNNGHRPRGAVPQNRQISALSGSRRPGPPDPYPPPSSSEQGYGMPPSTQQGYRPAPQQHLPTPYDDDNDFGDSQGPAIPERRPTPTGLYSPQTPLPPRASRQARQTEFYPETAATQPSPRRAPEVYPDHAAPRPAPVTARRAVAAPPEQGGKGTGAQLLDLVSNKLLPKVDSVVNESRNLRDTTDDIKESLKVVPTREEIKADIGDSFGQALSQFKNEITNSFKEAINERQRDIQKQIDQELRPVKEDLSRIISALALLQQQGVANPGQGKTIQALEEHLVGVLRPVDDLKNALLPLNLAQTLPQVLGLTHSLQALHNKVDQTISNTHGLSGAQTVQQAVLHRVTRVDERTAWQEQIHKSTFELVKKLDHNLGSLQVGNIANTEALNTILKGVEKQAEAVRDDAWLRQNSAESSTQTDTPASYVDSQVGTDLRAPLIVVIRTQQAEASDSQHLPDITFADSPDAVDEQLQAGQCPSSPTSVDTPRSLSLLNESQGASARPSLTTAQPPVKPKLKRRAPAKQPAAQALVQDTPSDDRHSTDQSEDGSGPAGGEGPHAGEASSTASTAPLKRRKAGRKPNDNAPASVTRRISRERKSPVRFGQTPPAEEQYVLVSGSQSATGPNRAIAPLPKKKKRAKGKGKNKAAGPNSAVAAADHTIDLAVNRFNSVKRNEAQQDRYPFDPPSFPYTPATQPLLFPGPLNLPITQPNGIPTSSFPSAVPETQLSGPSIIEPPQITRSTTRNLDGPTRQAFFAAPRKSVDMDDPLRDGIDGDDDGDGDSDGDLGMLERC